MIEETLTIERIKARFPEWIIAYDPSARSYWLLHWRYLDIGWRRVSSMLRIEAEIHGVQRRYSPYILPWERYVQDQPRALRGTAGMIRPERKYRGRTVDV